MRSLLLVLALGAAGCLSDLVPIDGPAGRDAAPAPSPSPSPAADGDGGTGAVTFAEVWSDVGRLGCANAGCHGGSAPMHLVAQPGGAADVTSNYMELLLRAQGGAQSPILVKNLQGSGVAHAGGSAFASTSDPTYVRWLAWIAAGAPQ